MSFIHIRHSVIHKNVYKGHIFHVKRVSYGTSLPQLSKSMRSISSKPIAIDVVTLPACTNKLGLPDVLTPVPSK